MTTEAQFYRMAEEWLYRLAERNPVTATHLGIHEYDSRLGDRTLAALEEDQREIRAALAQLRAMDLSEFRPDARIDHTLVTHILDSMVRSYEKFQGHLRAPGGYLEESLGGIFILIVRDFAPLPERLRSALGRVRETPRVLREGMANIIPERVPRVWAEIALEQARQAPGLFVLLPAIAAEAAPDLQADLAQAGQAAAQ
ncbi:MAG: DUF885 family protein, partial [Anaerolineae bacterium]